MAFSNNNNNDDDHQKKGHHSEMEWQRPVKGVDYQASIDEPGYEVPGVFRQHRHAYSAKPTEVGAYRRQITYRVGHIGTKELEIVLRDYVTMYGDKMTYADWEQFDSEVLDMENPQLQRYLINGDELMEEHQTRFMKELMAYVVNRKRDYAKYTPGIVY